MKAKKKNKKYEDLWMKIRDLIRSEKKIRWLWWKYMKIEFDSNDKLLLNKTI